MELRGLEKATILFIGRVFRVTKPGDEYDNGST